MKEYTIATEVMGLADNYDQAEGSTVRVAIHRLRKRLKAYYEGEGIADEVEVRLRPGQYTPEFIYRENTRGGQLEAPDAPFPEVEEGIRRSLAEDHGDRVEAEADKLPAPTVEHGRERPTLSAPAPLPPATRRAHLWWVGGAAIILLAMGAVYWLRSNPLTGKKTPIAQPTALRSAPANPLAGHGSPVRIMAGSRALQYTDAGGNLWLGDRYYQGGEERDIGGQAAKTNVPWIKRESDQNLVRHYRVGNTFSYEIPVQPGLYDLLLGFVETEFGADQTEGGGENARTFSIKINGEDAVDHLDVYAEAGGSYVLDARRFASVAPAADGRVHLQFATNSANPAIVSIIELVPQASDRVNPVRISTRPEAFVDNLGQNWIADNYYLGGHAIRSGASPPQTSVPELYETERFGSFSYSIPVPRNHTYRLTLHFTENYFGSTDDINAGKGVGARVFDVMCNGAVLLRDFDILKEAGAQNRAVTKTFGGLKASPHGQLLLSFAPSRNYALVNAIEVLDEGPLR